MAGDVVGFLLLEVRDLDKLRSKLEVIMEKRMGLDIFGITQ